MAEVGAINESTVVSAGIVRADALPDKPAKASPNIQIQSPEINKPPVPIKKEIPLQSGLHNLVESFKTEGGIDGAAGTAIEELADDFYSYLERLNPELRKMVEQALNNGNKDVIDTLARLKLIDYNEAIKNRSKLKDEYVQSGLKIYYANRLTKIMVSRIKAEYGRESVGELLDLGLAASGKGAEILSKQPKEIDAIKEAEKVLKELQSTPKVGLR